MCIDSFNSFDFNRFKEPIDLRDKLSEASSTEDPLTEEIERLNAKLIETSSEEENITAEIEAELGGTSSETELAEISDENETAQEIERLKNCTFNP